MFFEVENIFSSSPIHSRFIQKTCTEILVSWPILSHTSILTMLFCGFLIFFYAATNGLESQCFSTQHIHSHCSQFQIKDKKHACNLKKLISCFTSFWIFCQICWYLTVCSSILFIQMPALGIYILNVIKSRCSAERRVYLTSIDYWINMTGSLSPFLLCVSKNQMYMSIVKSMWLLF
jgi:hypothetical protein